MNAYELADELEAKIKEAIVSPNLKLEVLQD